MHLAYSQPVPQAAVMSSVVLTAAVLFGAGGVPSPIGEGAAILVSVATLVYLAVRPGPELRMPSPLASCAICAFPLLAIIQLVPLPYVLWSQLPLHDALVRSLELAGGQDRTWPIAIDPATTAWNLLSFIPPLAAFLFASSSGPRAIRIVLFTFVGLAIASAMLEALQLLGGAAFFIHPRAVLAGPSGLFANQNTQADWLVMGIIATLLLRMGDAGPPRLGTLPALAVVAFLVAGTVFTGSRAGIVLLSVALLYPIAVTDHGSAMQRAGKAGLIAIGAAAVALLALQFASIGHVIARFAETSDGRSETIWPDSIYLAGQAWPWGIGLGNFRYGFELVERLDVLSPTFANRAHADWLEFVIEGGVAAAAILVLGLVTVGLAIRSRIGGGFDTGAKFAVGCMIVLGLHSLVDYPLRAIPVAVLGAIALGWLAGRRNAGGNRMRGTT